MKTLITGQSGQSFSGLPSGASYRADSYGVITGVADSDVPAMLQAGCAYAPASSSSPYYSATYPHDWTEGTGQLTNGLITIPAPVGGKKRIWWLVQNQSSAAILVQYEARKIDGVTQVFASIVLQPGSSAGSEGASDERGFSAFIPQGIIKVSGAAASQVAIIEVAE